MEYQCSGEGAAHRRPLAATVGGKVKELEVTLRVRNNLLKERRLELGMNQGQLAKAVPMVACIYGLLENLRISPKNKRGEWRSYVVRLADYYRTTPDELFPDAVLRIVEPVAVRKLDAIDAPMLTTPHHLRLAESVDVAYDRDELCEHLDQILSTLTPREEGVLRLRYGIGDDNQETHTLKEVGEVFGVHKERIRQIQECALGKMRRNERYSHDAEKRPNGLNANDKTLIRTDLRKFRT